MARLPMPGFLIRARYTVSKCFSTLFRLLSDMASSAPPIGSPHLACGHTLIARYLTQSGKFSATNKRVKPSAFHLPLNKLAVSTFCVADLTGDVIWLLGDEHLSNGGATPVLAYAELSPELIAEFALAFNCDDRPIRHGHLGDFPVEKDKAKSMAQELAAKATLRVRPPPA